MLRVVRQVCLAGRPPSTLHPGMHRNETTTHNNECGRKFVCGPIYFFPYHDICVFASSVAVRSAGCLWERRCSRTQSFSFWMNPQWEWILFYAPSMSLTHPHTHTHSEKIGAPSCSHKWTSMQFESFSACHSLPQIPVTLAMTHIMRVHLLPQPSFALLLQSHCVTAPQTLIRLVCWLETLLLAKPFHTTITGKIC